MYYVLNVMLNINSIFCRIRSASSLHAIELSRTDLPTVLIISKKISATYSVPLISIID